MSLDYSYTIGYGFFVTEDDAEGSSLLSDADEYGALYEELLAPVEEATDGLISVTPANSPMVDSHQAVLVAIKRSLVEGEMYCSEHTPSRPLEIGNFDADALPQEVKALGEIADLLGIDDYEPRTYFYITVS